MSNVSIYEKNWIDLVFEGKNKAYGAYQLRQENSKTSLIAFLSGITFFLSVIGGGLFLTSFDDVTIDNAAPIIDDGPIITIDLTPKEPKAPQPEVQQSPQQPPSNETPPNLSNMVVVATPEANVDVPTNVEVKSLPPASEGTVGGTGIPNSGTEGSTVTTTPAPGGEGVENSRTVDVLPEYPGGIKKFYEYVGKNIDRPEIDEDSGEITMSVIMSFVIEKDGSMTDIKVLKSTDAKLEKEAIRVLKALKVKWTPGVKDGNKVRTQYMLPIKVKL